MYNIKLIYLKTTAGGSHVKPPPGSHVKNLAGSHVKNRAQHSPGSHVKFARDDRAE